MGIRKERIKEVFNINIHKLKDDFKKRCTIVGLRGKIMDTVLDLSIVLFVLYDIYIIYTVFSYIIAEKQRNTYKDWPIYDSYIYISFNCMGDLYPREENNY